MKFIFYQVRYIVIQTLLTPEMIAAKRILIKIGVHLPEIMAMHGKIIGVLLMTFQKTVKVLRFAHNVDAAVSVSNLEIF